MIIDMVMVGAYLFVLLLSVGNGVRSEEQQQLIEQHAMLIKENQIKIELLRKDIELEIKKEQKE